ncbi:hypothetical protein HBB16_20545 [Pseudonocardia sp. MCCB 268]|nr:hypothetical protein [Pseudonocardia cytotoxica]
MIPGLGARWRDAAGVRCRRRCGEGLLLVVLAGEHGVRDEDRLVELLAAVSTWCGAALGDRALTPVEDAAVDARARSSPGTWRESGRARR